jgi:hypothetical protein
VGLVNEDRADACEQVSGDFSALDLRIANEH